MSMYEEDYYDADSREMFADPGGRSALRKGKSIYPCPQCGDENVLSAADVRRGYRCDRCADRAEGLGW